MDASQSAEAWPLFHEIMVWWHVKPTCLCTWLQMGSMEYPPCWLASAPSTAPCSRHSTGHQYIFISPGSSRVSILECAWHILRGITVGTTLLQIRTIFTSYNEFVQVSRPCTLSQAALLHADVRSRVSCHVFRTKKDPSIPANYIHHGSNIGPISISWCDSCHGCAKKRVPHDVLDAPKHMVS